MSQIRIQMHGFDVDVLISLLSRENFNAIDASKRIMA